MNGDSCFLEQFLNRVNLEYIDMPFLKFTTGENRVTPSRHKSKFIFMLIEDKFKCASTQEAGSSTP